MKMLISLHELVNAAFRQHGGTGVTDIEILRGTMNLASGYTIEYECLGCGRVRKMRRAAESCSKTKYCGEEGIEKVFRCNCGQVYELLSDVRQCEHLTAKAAI